MIGNRVATVVIVLIFSAFLASVISAPRAAQSAMSMIKRIHQVREGNPVSDIAPDTSQRFWRSSKVAYWALLAALLLFLLFFVSDNVLHTFRDAKCEAPPKQS